MIAVVPSEKGVAAANPSNLPNTFGGIAHGKGPVGNTGEKLGVAAGSTAPNTARTRDPICARLHRAGDARVEGDADDVACAGSAEGDVG